ncbi:MAG: hypothetical protein GYB58_06875 [Gammaproteobacteria bacterium]|nr:hypothetical protein [Gammaproteobacteria bacterium]
MTLEASVIKQDAVRNTPSGYEVDIRISWYRSLPIACLENLSVTIDGQAYPAEQLTIKVNNTEIPVTQAGEFLDEWWFTQDPITALITTSNAKAAGEQVNIQVSLATRIPYVIIGPDTALVQRTDVSKEVTVQ